MATRGRPRKVQEEVDIAPAIEMAMAEEEMAEIGKQSTVEPNQEVTYETANEEVAPFDILLKGEYVKANWNKDRTKFHFNVPVGLVDRMEVHHHFVTGRIIRRD